jgi:hypothetical protein
MGCFDVLGQVNYLAVFACTVAAMILGSLWYSPVLFGNAWMKAVGLKKEDINKGDAFKSMLSTVILAFIGALVLATFILMTGTTKIFMGVHIGFLVAIGFISPVMLMNTLYEKRSIKAWWIHTFYQLLVFMINGAILTAWK